MRLRFTVPKPIFMGFPSTRMKAKSIEYYRKIYVEIMCYMTYMKQRVYIDTSVIGGYYDDEFKEYLRALFKEFIDGNKIAILSDITLAELKQAPKRIQKLIEKLQKNAVENVDMTKEADALSEMYVQDGIVSRNDFVDAQHIALATVIYADVLVSWNFRQIVNLERIRRYNSVNLKMGYHTLEIRTPREVLHEE